MSSVAKTAVLVVLGVMIEKKCREDLRALTTAWCEATGRTLTAASRKFYGKSRVFPDFLKGAGSMSIRAFDQSMAKMQADLTRLAGSSRLRAKRPKGVDKGDSRPRAGG